MSTFAQSAHNARPSQEPGSTRHTDRARLVSYFVSPRHLSLARRRARLVSRPSYASSIASSTHRLAHRLTPHASPASPRLLLASSPSLRRSDRLLSHLFCLASPHRSNPLVSSLAHRPLRGLSTTPTPGRQCSHYRLRTPKFATPSRLPLRARRGHATPPATPTRPLE